MKLVALLSWYREDPAWLYRAVKSLERLDVQHLVALDGAYALFPRARNRSGLAEHEAITSAAYELGIGVTIHVPGQPWQGGEIEKRTALFRYGDQVTTDGEDWYVVVDADEVVRDAPADLHERLRTSLFDVADVTFSEVMATGHRDDYPIPILFRARHGIVVTGNHFTYRSPTGGLLWGNARTEKMLPRLDLTGNVVVDHFTELRHDDRKRAAKDYYRARDEALIEAGPCHLCSQPASRTLPYHWREVGDGHAAEWVEVCAACAPSVVERGKDQLRAFGLDPDRVLMYERQGPVPA